MTLTEAMNTFGPAWLQYWLPVLFVGAFVLPLALFIWRETRMAAVFCIVASFGAAFAIDMLFQQMGYVKLLGLPHIILWTPLAIYLWRLISKGNAPRAARVTMGIVLTVITISLAFDYVDVARFALGERAPATIPAQEG
ncbi:hypothetical protein AB3Y40_10835 [Yoonia sp. R2331]|uniref:hypothetical protein n=1 Tax=Yoonia sp. R2331 TaxID=3237238 RepID=UPI0034E48460